MYSMASPSVRESGWPQVRQTAEDFSTFCAEQRRKQVETTKNKQDSVAVIENCKDDTAVHKKSFMAAQAKLPSTVQDHLRENDLKQSYKKSGVESNQRAAAATAWIVEHRNSWQLCPMAWAGGSDLDLEHLFLQKFCEVDS